MLVASLIEVLSGLGLLTAAVMGGVWLKRLSLRRPQSVMVNDGMLADMVCVGAVMLLVVGAMLAIRGVIDLL